MLNKKLFILCFVCCLVVSLSVHYFYFEYSKSYWVNSAVILSLFSLVYFSLRTIWIIFEGMSVEHSEQGNLPVLSVVYSLASIYFFLKHIGHYEKYFDDNRDTLVRSLTLFEDFYTLELIANICLFSSIVALGWNISKSILTINSLEYGVIKNFVKIKGENGNEKKVGDYGKLYLENADTHVKRELGIRFIICITFVFLESVLAHSPIFDVKKVITSLFGVDPNDFILLGSVSFILYFSILIWFYINKKKFGDNFISKEWRENSKRQFIYGIIVSITMLSFGGFIKSNDYTLLITLFVFTFILSAFLLMYQIFTIEFNFLKSNGTTTTN